MPERHKVNSRGQRPRVSAAFSPDPERVAASTIYTTQVELWLTTGRPLQVERLDKLSGGVAPAIDSVPFRDKANCTTSPNNLLDTREGTINDDAPDDLLRINLLAPPFNVMPVVQPPNCPSRCLISY
jgi:hypothetical protein